MPLLTAEYESRSNPARRPKPRRLIIAALISFSLLCVVAAIVWMATAKSSWNFSASAGIGLDIFQGRVMFTRPYSCGMTTFLELPLWAITGVSGIVSVSLATLLRPPHTGAA